jgi:general secretion pathway protein G
MKKHRQSGFSLMELLVAMMILAVLATIGVKKYQEFASNARYVKAHADMKTVAEGLDQYFLKHGKYPDLTSYESMVEPNSPLVKENLIPAGISPMDPWGDHPYEGTSGKGTYVLKCAGDPNGSVDRQAFTIEPGKVTDNPTAAATPGTPQEPAK